MPTSITFHYEAIDFKIKQAKRLRQWMVRCAQQEGKEIDTLSFIFCDDAYLHQINLDYLQHDTYTDIITFPYNESPISGDIFISIQRVRENALQFEVSFDEELRRVIIHGVLHLLGYKDKTKKEKATMTEKENQCLVLFSEKV